jgi:pyridoxamine 5'-phosphate oxidase
MPPTPDPGAFADTAVAGADDTALANGFDRAWAMLAAAPGDPTSGLRLPVVATVSDGAPDARVIVVRSVDRAAHSLTVYSDRRAAKIAVLAAAPRVAVTGYDTATRLQLRLHGTATVATAGADIDAAWAALTPFGRSAYQNVEPPGTPVPHPLGPPVLPADGGRAAFAVITIVVDRFEWLDLAVPGHRRGLHVRDGGGWKGCWLVP